MIDSRPPTNAALAPSPDDETREQLERGAKTFIRALLRHMAAVESRMIARIDAAEERMREFDATLRGDVTNGDGMS